MEFINKIQYFLNTTLPNSLIELFHMINNIMSPAAGWFLLLLLIISTAVIFKIYKRENHLKRHEHELDEIFFKIAKLHTVDSINTIFAELASWLNGNYFALYYLHGETYVLVSSNINTDAKNSSVAASLHLKQRNFKRFYNSGNFTVSSYQSISKKFIIRFYSANAIDLDRYQGTLEVLFSAYDVLKSDTQQSTDIQQVQTSRELFQVINGENFSEDGYMKYILSLVKKTLNAKQIILKDQEKTHIQFGERPDKYEKIFYIRNTDYKVVVYTEKTIDNDSLLMVGSFLDLTGTFISTLSEDSSIVKNYIKFLERANIIQEDATDNALHSNKVHVVAMEIGKKLLLSTDELEALGHASKLHDIGLIYNYDVNNDSRYLTQTKKIHPIIGAILVEPIANSYPISTIIKYHHERLDGSGYPFALKGNSIPILAQIVGFADYFIEIIAQEKFSIEDDYKELIVSMSIDAHNLFDNVIIEAFLEINEGVKKKIQLVK